MTEPERPADAPSRSRRLPTTRWSVVRAAADAYREARSMVREAGPGSERRLAEIEPTSLGLSGHDDARIR